MQLNKSSKKTKTAAEKTPVAAAPAKNVAPAAEVNPNPRAVKSSTPKKSEEKVTASPSHHHKVVPSPAVAEPRAAQPKPVELELVETVTVTKTTKIVAHEDIARLAYSYWVARGHAHGSPDEDWARAERELKQ